MVDLSECSADQPAADAGAVIRSLRVLRSGWAEQHEEHRYGSPMPRLWWVLTSRSWVKLPINYFVIEHRSGLILFDTGLDPAIVSDPGYISSAIGRWLLRRIFRLHLSDNDSLDKALSRLGLSCSDIRCAVISHLHFDHVGGIGHIPQADLLVSKNEWAQLLERHPEREWILREHIEIAGARWRPIAFQPATEPIFDDFGGAFDVAGDGSMMLLPTPGHTPGSLSMLVRRDGWAPILLVGDLTYEAALLERGTVPGTGDAAQLRKTFTKVRKLKQLMPDLVIVPSHDFAAGDQIVRATRAV